MNITKLLIENGADVHARDISGGAPLHQAAKFSQSTVYHYFSHRL